jgi:hypothetical protein
MQIPDQDRDNNGQDRGRNRPAQWADLLIKHGPTQLSDKKMREE